MKKLLIALLIGAFSIVPLILIGCDEGKEVEADTTAEEGTTEEETPIVEEGATEETPVTEGTLEGEAGTVAEPTETTEEPVTE